MGRDRKLSVATPPLETLSRHKVFCRDRKGPTLVKLCHDIRGPVSRPKHLVLAPNPVATKNLCRESRPKISFLTEKTSVATQPLSMLGNLVVTRRSLLQHRDRKLCRASQPSVHVCCACPDRVVCLALEPCHNTEDLVATQG